MDPGAVWLGDQRTSPLWWRMGRVQLRTGSGDVRRSRHDLFDEANASAADPHGAQAVGVCGAGGEQP